MMNVDLICVGKLNAAYCAEGVAEYQKRLGAYCRFRIVELPEETIREKNASQSVIDKALEKEGAAILAQVKRGAALVALCVEGKERSSEELARYLADSAAQDASHIVFLIGSSFGMHESLKRQAALRLSMSPMTFPHHLLRVMLLEQIYRAYQINAGSRYHK